jgi:hypothetical protein
VARTAANSTTVVSLVRVGAIAVPAVGLHVWILHQIHRITTPCSAVGSTYANTDSHSNNVAVGCVVVGTCAIIIISSTTRITHDHRVVKGVGVGVDVVRVAG